MTTLRALLKQWFPQRNLIIVSEHKVRHLPISGRTQCIALLLLAGGVCWGAYSTGSYMAARMVLKAQTHTLHSIATARVNTNFNVLYPTMPLVAAAMDAAAVENPADGLNNPALALSALDNDKLFARMAFLEQKVAELQQANSSIIQRVREKTASRINGLENVIKQAGLKSSPLKKEVSEKNARNAEGGPYIPTDMSVYSPEEQDMYVRLDELALLQQVVDALPLAAPMRDYSLHSGFGRRVDPFTGRLAYHTGLDLSGENGARVYSPAGGKVTYAGRRGAYGNMVEINHGFNVTTRYGHLSRVLVKEGQTVRQGNILGIQGSTGRSTGSHLHYEVRYHDKPMNPKNFLKAGTLYVSQE